MIETIVSMEKLVEYLDQTLRSFELDPADTDYQRGYRAALIDLENLVQI